MTPHPKNNHPKCAQVTYRQTPQSSNLSQFLLLVMPRTIIKTHPHQLGMGRDVGRSLPEHPEQVVARVLRWRPQSRQNCRHNFGPVELTNPSSTMNLEHTTPCTSILSSSMQTTTPQASNFICLCDVRPIQTTR